ncbi:hypothetical protein [Streptacidiphilus sp. PAMC 29251]
MFVRLWLRRLLSAVSALLVLLVVAGLSVWLSVRVTPLQSVSAIGQSVQVGAASPSLSPSGPGELDLFGQVIPTRPRFDGPIRPRLRLTHISLNAQANTITKPGQQGEVEAGLSRALTSGWTRYLLWESLIAVGFAALMAVAIAGIARSSRAAMFRILAAAVVAVCALNAVGVYLLASSTPKALRQVRSVADLVGESPAAAPTPGGPALGGVQAVVIGDSTAAAIGNPLVAHPVPWTRPAAAAGTPTRST